MPKRRQHGEGALFQLKTGYWRGVVDMGEDTNGRRIQKYVHGKTQRIARDKLDTLKAEIREHGAPLSKQVTVSDWSVRWLERVVRDVDPKTFSGYRGVIRNWIVPTIGRHTVAALKPSDVLAVRDAIRDAGRGTSTARQAHIVLSMLLDAAVGDRLCASNVAKGVRKPGGAKRAPKVKRGALTTDQALAILRTAAALPDAAGSRPWFKVLSGQRPGEILGATIADLDLDAGTYEVAWKLEELRRDHGCGGTCGYKQAARCPDAVWRVPDDFEMVQIRGAWHLTRPKSGTGRVIPLIPQLVEATRRHLAAMDQYPNPHGLIWRNKDGSPILPKQDAQDWRDLLEAAGVITAAENKPGGTELTSYWTRHTAVTVLASLGVDFQIIGELVGHTTAQVTAIYRHAADDEKRAAMEALGGKWADALALPAAEQPADVAQGAIDGVPEITDGRAEPADDGGQ